MNAIYKPRLSIKYSAKSNLMCVWDGADQNERVFCANDLFVWCGLKNIKCALYHHVISGPSDTSIMKDYLLLDTDIHVHDFIILILDDKMNIMNMNVDEYLLFH